MRERLVNKVSSNLLCCSGVAVTVLSESTAVREIQQRKFKIPDVIV